MKNCLTMRRLCKNITVALGLAFAVPVFASVNITVKSGDTLSAVIAKYRPTGIAAMDMVIAIRNANPAVATHGFQAGMHLKIPTTVNEVRQAITGSSSQKPAVGAKTQVIAKKAAPVVRPKPVLKPATTTVAVAADNKQITSYEATIHSLQQELNNQAQTLKNYQAQIADMTTQLNSQNNLDNSIKPKSTNYLPLSGLWFILWLFTFILFLRARKKNNVVSEMPNTLLSSTGPTLTTENKIHEPIAPTISPAFSKKSDSQQNKNVEPRLYESGNEENWRQVELDISATEAFTSPHAFEPAHDLENQPDLSHEQQSIIREIANDHDNIEWHMALLEFYIKTGNPGGFMRHMQTMIRTGLMTEGDPLWEKIRKMYLNGWIYKEEQ